MTPGCVSHTCYHGDVSVISLRQVEGFYWVASLGGVERAARHLNTTQSAMSKRIQDLEAALDLTLFDRSQRRVRLTVDGDRLLATARDMIALRDRMLEFRDTAKPAARTLRLGVTELTAMTWLPMLTERLKPVAGSVVLEPHVDASTHLVRQLQDDALDIVIVPDAFPDPLFKVIPLDVVDYAWMCRPGYIKADRPLPLRELSGYTVIDQVHASGLGDIVRRWLGERRVGITSTLPSSSLSAVAALTIAGHGISYLPLRMFQPLISSGRLRVLETRPRLPRIPYVTMFKKVRDDDTIAAVTSLIGEACDFTAASVLHG